MPHARRLQSYQTWREERAAGGAAGMRPRSVMSWAVIYCVCRAGRTLVWCGVAEVRCTCELECKARVSRRCSDASPALGATQGVVYMLRVCMLLAYVLRVCMLVVCVLAYACCWFACFACACCARLPILVHVLPVAAEATGLRSRRAWTGTLSWSHHSHTLKAAAAICMWQCAGCAFTRYILALD